MLLLQRQKCNLKDRRGAFSVIFSKIISICFMCAVNQYLMADSPSSSPAYIYSDFFETFPIHVQEKIRCAFDHLHDDLIGFIQFWKPLKIGGRWLLTTSDQPFLLDDDKDTEKYRLCSVKYKYNVDVNKVEVEKDVTIISGAPATAFLNQRPEFIRDLTVHEMTPLASSAVECGLHRSLVLPVFYRSKSCCVGVVECCSLLYISLIEMFNDLNIALEIEGLKLFQTPEHLPYKTICSLKPAKDEIDGALKFIWQTIRLDFAQVWIAYKDEDHVALSSSFEDRQTKRMLGLKLTHHYNDSFGFDNQLEDDYISERYEGYSRICSMLSLKMGEGLIGKTLQSHEPHFVRKVSKLSNDEPQILLSSCEMEGVPYHCSCFVICLRSTETSDLEYVFEFIWHKGPNYVKLLESLLLSLKRCLPNFKYASGAELGDELRIIDVENSTESEIKYFKIFKGIKSSSTSKALEKSSLVITECATPLEANCKATPISLSQEDMVEAAQNLNVCSSTLKRKCNDLDMCPKKDYFKRNVNPFYKNQSDKNEEDEGAFQDPSANNKEMYLDESMVTIKAEYADNMIKLRLPISSATFVAIGNEIGKRLKLNPANYKLKYLDEDGDWILLTCDEDVKACIKDRTNLSSIVRLRLLP